MILLFTLGYFYFLVGIRDNFEDNCLNFLSVLSSFSSIVGIFIALWQIGKISNDLEIYKNKQNISRIATATEKIKNAKNLININNLEVIKLLDEAKELLMLSENELRPVEISLVLKKLSSSVKILIKAANIPLTEEYKDIIYEELVFIHEFLIKLH